VRDPEINEDFLRCVAEMAEPDRRADAARLLAAQVDADDLTVFVRDPDIGQSLPAPGFPQTLQGGREWRNLVEDAVRDGSADAAVKSADGQPTRARAIALPDGTVLAFLGMSDPIIDVPRVRILLPLLGALFRSELATRRAEAESALARKAAADAVELTGKLETTRGDLQRALMVAESASRARDEFLATVSHELRTPLTSMIGWIQVLRDEKNPQIVTEGLDTIDRNARAQSRLIEDILDFSRIDAGKVRLDVQPVDLSHVVDAALEVARPAADAKGVGLDRVLDPNAGPVAGDPDRLQQVIWNLLSNSVKFTSRGGRVQVRLERNASQAMLTISDTGEGIPESFLPHVFDRFSQADSTSTRTHGGLGLGLGIVRHLVSLHGGTVQAFSPGLGKGSSFVVRLPLMATQPEGIASSEVATAARGGMRPDQLTGVSILIVEDNDDARRLLTTILKRSGAAVQPAESVSRALILLRASHPDIIISDIEMPGEDGYSLIRKVRLEESPSSRIPAIALTAYTQSADRVRALDAGFQTHMAKPVEPAELVATVKSLLATSRHTAHS
jgi:signal transduction histidine kinase/ActR/RegA family two-component response regulator